MIEVLNKTDELINELDNTLFVNNIKNNIEKDKNINELNLYIYYLNTEFKKLVKR